MEKRKAVVRVCLSLFSLLLYAILENPNPKEEDLSLRVPPILVVRIPQTPLVASQFDDQIRTLWREFTNKMSVFTSKKILRPKSKNFVVGNTGNQLAFSELESAS